MSKAATVAASIGGGSAAIIAKIVDGNITENLGKDISKSYRDTTIYSIFSYIIDLTGHPALDLLKLTHFFQSTTLNLLYLVLYWFLILTIDEKKVEFWLIRVLPEKYVQYLLIAFLKSKKVLTYLF